ncbi:hypothetical protein HYU40_01585 [Candidatus Woesearchaeota archaeon]|nr:hypothetical protein [Candidatus Woesearchaeota archaeon]
MGKRGSYEIKKSILMAVREKPASYAELERKVNTGFRSIKNNSEELSDYGYITVERVERDPANGRPSFKVKISESGRSFLNKKGK